MESPLLKITNLTMSFGGLKALKGLDLEVASGEIVALIGPNGAGKTTFFNCVTGIYTPTKGDIFLENPKNSERISLKGLLPNRVTKAGIARTFQNIRLFSKMTVLENVMIGRHCRTKAFILGAILRDRKTRQEEREIQERSYEILEQVGLEKFANEFAQNLSYGGQRRLEIARALATDPFLLLLDEPAAGMNPQETQNLVSLIKEIAESGIAILLIEHDMKLVMSLSERIYVLDYGTKIAQGTPSEIRSNPDVIKAYLGE
jgi:branched-chain amino acid transport system ATP-binding protein